MSRFVSNPHVLNPLTPRQDLEFSAAADACRELWGSYEKMAEAIEPEVGRRVNAVTMRRWLVDRTIPPRIAFILAAVTQTEEPSLGIRVDAFHPWLTEYIR